MFKNVRRCKGISVRKAESVPVIDLALTILWDVVSQALQRQVRTPSRFLC